MIKSDADLCGPLGWRIFPICTAELSKISEISEKRLFLNLTCTHHSQRQIHRRKGIEKGTVKINKCQ